MRKRAGTYIAAWLAVIVAWRAAPLAGLAVTAGAGGLYWWSLRRHPYVPCPRCGGSKAHVDTTFLPGTGGRCLVCSGKGLMTRLGVKLFMPATAREIRAGKKGKYH